MVFTDKDRAEIAERNLDERQLVAQLERFKNGFPPARLDRPATAADGIRILSEEEVESFIGTYERSDARVMKFVPASGAATRMFKMLFHFLDHFEGSESSYEKLCGEQPMLERFFTHLDAFAFYGILNEKLLHTAGCSTRGALAKWKHDEIVRTLLLPQGLNYGHLPKGLIAFHRYENGEIRTPVQEHLYEGRAYAQRGDEVFIHFTVSPQHVSAFQGHVEDAIEKMGAQSRFSVTFSTQKPETDTLAVTPSFEPFRDEHGRLVFRPAGHGALLENLNDLDAEVVFIKNIDNVVTDEQKGETIRYKKVLGGVLLHYQKQIFDLLRKHDGGEDILAAGRELLQELGASKFEDDEIPALLNRPIRVCGMVKNQGEPGGGPFWVRDERGRESLQIVESAQVNHADPEQEAVFKKGTHFNPVDLVCGIRDYKGDRFDLMKYRDDEAGFISEKSYKGKKLLAMELPGLWNGSMAHWNTIFVEVPLITFNPVKTVNDLLKPGHCQSPL